MKITIEAINNIKSQEITLGDKVSIIYGLNNCGKTSILKAINSALYKMLRNQYYHHSIKSFTVSTYIPTNRIMIRNANLKYNNLVDIEVLLNYEKDMFTDYDIHLMIIRQYLLQNIVINNFIYNVIDKLFNMKLPLIEGYLDIKENRYSDGIENIINIYLNIIWILTWDKDVPSLTKEEFDEIRLSNKANVLIDEVEMFLHVSIQAKLINSLREDFAKCRFICTTHSPLLLTRYKDTDVFNIEDGILDKIEDKLFYEDLNIIYEEFFHVEELPNTIKLYLNYLGDVIRTKENIDLDKINFIDHYFKSEYPNIYFKYNKILTKAKFIGENNV